MKTIYYDSVVIAEVTKELRDAFGAQNRSACASIKRDNPDKELRDELKDMSTQFYELARIVQGMGRKGIKPWQFFTEMAELNGIPATHEQLKYARYIFEGVDCQVDAKTDHAKRVVRIHYLQGMEMLFTGWRNLLLDKDKSKGCILALNEAERYAHRLIDEMQVGSINQIETQIRENVDYTIL